MKIRFYKYQGTGNDFVIIDNRSGNINLHQEQVEFLCHRRFGIGADGLMLLSNHDGYDFEMIYFNSDGRESSMCGNGGRCLVQFANDVGLKKSTYNFLAIDGEHEAAIREDGLVALKMNDVNQIQKEENAFILNTGSPHFVQLINDVEGFDVFNKGKEIRYSNNFKEQGINVNFVQKLKQSNEIFVRTYERGVEDETFSCGTGVTAAAIVCDNGDGFNSIGVKTKGGKLFVEFNKQKDVYTDVWLIGAAVKVFEGEIEI